MIYKVSETDLEQCVDIIYETDFAKKYYPLKELLYDEMKKGLVNDEMYVSKKDEVIQGVIWYQQCGMFATFPYLHMIAVKPECQNQKVGTELLEFFEQNSLSQGKNKLRTKVFLLVGDYNELAENVYIKRGYIKIGEMESLFRKNVTEKLYMKVVKKKW